MRRLHVLLGAQSILLVLASINRLWSGTDAEVLPHGSLRVVELLNLLVLPPASVLLFYVLLEDLRPTLRLRIAFLASVYVFALSYGMHEPANYLHDRFCDDERGALCSIVAYQDDELSHFLFFAGFAGIDAVLLLAAARAGGVAARGRDLALVLANAALVAAAIIANLAFEEIGLDLIFIAAVAALALALLRRHGPLPLIVYFASAYSAGLLVTAAVKLL